jgi:hypothetical protein
MTMRHSESHPSIDHIRFALAEYQQSRQFRVKNICDAAYFAMRVETLATLKHWCIAFFVLPRSRDYLIDRHCNAMVGATKLDFLPIPETSLGGTISFDATRGAGQKDSQARRALRALPLLALLFAAPYIARDVFPFTEGLSVSSRLAIDNRSFMRLFDAIKGIDKHLSLEGGPDQTLGSPTIKFMADFAPLQVIWTIESLRRGNFLTFATFPALLGIVSQFTGLEYVAPLYYFLHYVQTPLEKYHALDNRLVPTHYAKTLIPGVMVSYLLPTIAIFHMPLSVDTGRWISVTCLLYPIWTALVHHIFASFVMDTTNHDRIHNPRADMVYLRRAYAFGAIASGVVYRCPWMTSLLSTPDISSHGILSPDPQATVVAAWVRYNHLITFAGGLMWQLLHFIDLKKAQRLNVRLAYIVGVVAGTALLLGPGAAMAVAWSWREEQLSNGRDTAYKLH